MHQSIRARHRRLRRAAGRSAARRGLLGGSVVLLAAVGGSLFVGLALLLSAYTGLANSLPPEPSAAFAHQNLGPAKIYDRNGTLLYEFEDETEGLRKPVTLADISPYLIKATIATEDNSFYSNPGVNVRGLARAGVENFIDSDSGVLQGTGGSSITQQLVKNSFIEEEERFERSVNRKIKETVFALELTRRYSKNQILEWYLNQIDYGNRASGIGAAARRYFNTTARDLTLAQSAMLAGLPQSPARHNPYRDRDAALARQREVLDLMVRHGQITEAEAAAARTEELVFAKPDVSLLAPHWVFYVRDLLIARVGIETFRRGGLRVTTTLDLNLQTKAEQVIEEKIAYYESPRGGNCECHNASLVAIDNNTGQILAMVGSRNYWRTDIEGENNNAIAIKQPGSAFKPIVYVAAFEKGWNPGTTIYDQPTKFISRIDGSRREYFTPEGPTRNWNGPLSARVSLGSSMNTAAVKSAGFVGVDGVIDMAHRAGITTLNDRESYGVSIATGGSNLTLLDLTYAYSTIANNGEMRGMPALKPAPGLRRIDPVALLQVVDGNGRVLVQFTGPSREQVVQAGYAYQVTDILKDNNAKRLTYTAPEVQFSLPDKRPIAAKTGTQQGPKDIRTVLATWNFGYVPDLTVGVWVGNANNALVNSNLTSASSSLLIWKEVMAAAVEILHIPPKEFAVPPDIHWENVNGHNEPIVNGTKVVRAEDLKLWAAAGNPVVPYSHPTPTPTPEGDQPPASGAPAQPEGPRQPAQPAATATPARPNVPGLPAPTPARPPGVPGLTPPPGQAPPATPQPPRPATTRPP
jgi:membrane peptidoglycan carboxypeptidase